MSKFPYAEHVEQVWNARNPTALERFFTADVRVHSFTPGIAPVVGIRNFQALAQSLFDGFPDVRFTIEDVIEDERGLAARLFLEGTHQGEFAGMPATGRHMRVVDFAMYRIVNGKFTDVWSLVDIASMREQLGTKA